MASLASLFGEGGGAYTKQLQRLFDGIDVPEEKQIQLQQYIEQGLMTPEQARAELVGDNAYDDMQLDTEGHQAQLAALQSLSDIGNEGGLTASDRSKMQAIQNQEQSAAKGAREAILQNAAARGAGGSGLELMAQLQNQQDSATRQSTRDLDVAAMAQDRALQALQQAGSLGGQINQQQFGQQAQVADAKNEIAKFNAANKQQVGMTNVAANNQAQAANLANKQDTSNKNVDIKNQQNQQNNSLGQQTFNNQMSLAQGRSGALNTQSQQANAEQAANKQLIGTGVGALASIYGKSDEEAKEDVEKFNASDFLDSLTGYKYKYKDSRDGKGKQVGVMAQDLEREVPQMVHDTAEGKMVDYSPKSAGGPIFAGMSDLHERLKRLEGK